MSLCEDKDLETFARECSQWFYTDAPSASGVVLLVHGLNQKPSSWMELIQYLNRNGLHVYRLALQGHRGLAFDDMRKVNAEIWEQEMLEGYREITLRFPMLRVNLIAYSLGGLVSMLVQLKAGKQLFVRQVLLAPALAIRPYTRFAQLLCRIFPHLPSRSPQGYVANREGTTAEAYRALFQLEKDFRKFADISLLNIPTLVMMRQDDELISYKGTRRFLESKKLDKWQMIPLTADSALRICTFSYKHLIVDSRSAGKEVWGRITAEMHMFLNR
jgi:alpha-beta hydrolase superfamily lysophospholipase